MSFDSNDPFELPDASQEEDDNTWMNKFGKEPVTKTRSFSHKDPKSGKKEGKLIVRSFRNHILFVYGQR